MIRSFPFQPAPILRLTLTALITVSAAAAPNASLNTAPNSAPNPSSKNASKPAPPRDPLSGFRELASDLWAQGPGPDSGVVLEYRLHRRSNACTGLEPEVRLRLSGDGRLELLRTRSFAESDRAGPGGFSGRIGKRAWDSLFAQVSGMEWETALPGLPMPGMSESRQVIELRQAGRAARFEFSGAVPAGHDRIANGLAAVTGMIRAATADTLWSLSLGAEPGKYKQGVLRTRAAWTLRGKSPMRFRMPVEGGKDMEGGDGGNGGDGGDGGKGGKGGKGGCGTLGLRWTLLPKDVPGFTAVPSERNWTFPKNGLKMDRRNEGKYDSKAAGKPTGMGQGIAPGAWQELQPGDSVSVSGVFLIPKAKNSSRVEREGSLMHMGIPVGLAGSEDTLAVVTLFSGYFRF
jgi:hypothetical protein